MSDHDGREERMLINFSEQAHVGYILTAEFDVDAGPVISHQYPEPLGGNIRYPQISPSQFNTDIKSKAGRVDVTRSGPQ